MSEPAASPKLTRQRRQQAARGDETRERILRVAIDTFGLNGFEGASTRMIAKAAGVNIQAIQYYFGGKEGLYLAAADQIGAHLRRHLGPAAERIRARLEIAQGKPPSPEEARELLIELLGMAANAIAQEASSSWARFMIREQMEPTEAFERIYSGVMRPIIVNARRLVGAALGEDPESEKVGVRTLATVGQVVFFRVARAAVLRQLGWSEIGAREMDAIKCMIRDTVSAMTPSRNREPGS